MFCDQIWDIYSHFSFFSSSWDSYYACDCILHVIVFLCSAGDEFLLICLWVYWFLSSLQICSSVYCIVCFRTGLWFFLWLVFFYLDFFYLFFNHCHHIFCLILDIASLNTFVTASLKSLPTSTSGPIRVFLLTASPTLLLAMSHRFLFLCMSCILLLFENWKFRSVYQM